jgi:hypothetical protein
MIKFNFPFRYLLLTVFVAFFLGCSSEIPDKEVEIIYKNLKDNQAKFIFKLNGDNFYAPESIFDGHLEIYPTTFSLGSFDQFGSNVMIHFGGKDIYKNKPMKIPLRLENGHTSPVMFGRIKDKKNNLGDGYLMSEGFITFKAFSKEKIVMRIEGKAKKYPKTYLNDKSFNVSALIICKKPKIGYIDIDEKAVFYGQ